MVEPRDTKALLNKVEEFINLPIEEKEKMGLAARKKVENEFDRKIVVDEYIKMILK